ncbi:MAG: SPFH/Band 7/PHB domain protein [Campylobacterales bacterium]|nr:SPFH/Band 7/PHB domain protein [Campylobacterales bacterium]
MLESALFSWVIGIFFLLAILVVIYYTVGFESIMPLVIIESQEAWVVDRLGKDRVLYEGINRIIPWIDRIEAKVSLKEQPIDPPPQNIITKDNISIKVDMIAMIKIVEPMKAIQEVSDYKEAVKSLVMTSVVDTMGKMELKDIQTQLTNISKEVIKHIEEESLRWGIKIVQVRFEEVDYSNDIKKSMEQITIAENNKTALIAQADAKKEAAQREAEALLHKIETIKKSMNQIPDERILEFLKSMDYINSMQSLSASSNAKFVLYPSGDQQAVDKIMRTEYLSQSMDKKS